MKIENAFFWSAVIAARWSTPWLMNMHAITIVKTDSIFRMIFHIIAWIINCVDMDTWYNDQKNVRFVWYMRCHENERLLMWWSLMAFRGLTDSYSEVSGVVKVTKTNIG